MHSSSLIRLKTWQPHSNLKLRDIFGIPVKQFLDHLDHTTNLPMLQQATSTSSKLDLERAASKSTTSRKDRKEHSLDRLHPHSSDKNWRPHPNLELSRRIRIPVNQFWTTWITLRTFPILQRATSTLPKLERETSTSPKKDRKEHSTERLHPKSYDKDLATSS